MATAERPALEVVVDAEAAVAKAVDALAARLTSGARTLGLSGGTTPKRVYEALGERAELPWSQIHFYFGDERCVPPEHPESNFRMAREALARGGHARLDHLHRMRAELPDREAAAREYEAVLPASLDVLMLGVGEDGHTASLFPGSEALRETARRVVPVQGAKPPPWRLTVTPPVLAAARQLLVLACGEGKAAPVARALSEVASAWEVPSHLAARAGALWILDHAAAPR